MTALRRLASDEFDVETFGELRSMVESAWPPGQFTPEDWEHALGGAHFVVEDRGEIVAHASVVARRLESADLTLATGYVEAVATRPGRQGEGHGSSVMRAASEHVREAYELGALSTGRPTFYERLGWVPWRGPTSVRARGVVTRTPEEDGAVLVLLTPASPALDLDRDLICDWRRGDVW